MFTTYILYSKKFKRMYIGHTNNIDRRFKQHNFGKVLSTKAYKPYELIWTEQFQTKKEAIQREKDLKTSSGRRFIKKLIDE